jgi:formylglycine-generating enzyme required for sulfatase activity
MLEENRERTDSLFRTVDPEAMYERPIPERHRIIFYLGHLEAFDWNLVGAYAMGRRSAQPGLDKLFAFGIDPPPGELPSDAISDWPSLEEVRGYCARTREAVDALVDGVPEQLLHVAIEHRQMHIETFGYILHQLAYDRKIPASREAPLEDLPAREPWMIDIPAGRARLGLSGESFGWDNEFHAHEVDVPAFSMAKHKITNGEYLRYMQATGAAAPFFWTRRGIDHHGEWFLRAMFEEIPLPLDWPVYATHDEASAYAKWRGAALATEAQYHRAAELANGSAYPAGGNLDLKRWDPIPVQANDSAAGAPSQLAANGWEWTSTEFAPFPGFEPFPFYRNYSEPFFDGQHYVLKGASPLTAAKLARPSFRNWFRPAYPYVYATFRLVES